MRTFVAVAAVAVLGGLAGRADAQIVYGTGGATMPGGGVPMLGYTVPYPGAITSPFRPAAVNGYHPHHGFYNPGMYNRGFYNSGFYNGGFYSNNHLYYNGAGFGNGFAGPNMSGYGFPNTRFGSPGTYYHQATFPGTYYHP